MPEVIRRPFAGGLTTAGGLLALVIGLAAIDGRVRDEIARAFTSRGPANEITIFGSRLTDMAMIAARAARDQTFEHALLAVFALGAGILVLLMTRTY